MARIVLAVACALSAVTGCGDGEQGASGSGLPASLEIGDLNAVERERMCAWIADQGRALNTRETCTRTGLVRFALDQAACPGYVDECVAFFQAEMKDPMDELYCSWTSQDVAGCDIDVAEAERCVRGRNRELELAVSGLTCDDWGNVPAVEPSPDCDLAHRTCPKIF